MPQIASQSISEAASPTVEVSVGRYEQRDGNVVYVTAVEDDYPVELGLNTYPVIGMTQDGLYDRWTRDGRFDEGGPHPCDLVRRIGV